MCFLYYNKEHKKNEDINEWLLSSVDDELDDSGYDPL